MVDCDDDEEEDRTFWSESSRSAIERERKRKSKSKTPHQEAGRNFWAETEVFLSNFATANFIPLLPKSAVADSVCWKPPAFGFSVSVDAALNLGAVSMEIAEAVAVLEGIHLALSSDFSPIVVATDALSVEQQYSCPRRGQMGS
ncbi:hypothetical protein ACOSQ2_015887 [Xanthoceras sorbifolium]